MRQYEPLIVSDILDNPFTDVTLEDIGMSLPLLGGSLMGDRERHPCSDGENDRTSQARVEIEIMDLCSKAVTEVSSVSCTDVLTHGCGNTCDPVSILYLPVFSKLQVLLPKGKI